MQQLKESIEQSELEVKDAATEFGVSYRMLRKYLAGEGNPRKSTIAKLERMMTDLSKRPAKIKHPSYGYATPEQMEQLKTLGIGPTRDKLLADIAKANKKKGKK